MIIGRIQIGLENFLVFNPDNSFSENDIALKLTAELRNSSGFVATISNNNLNLLYPTKPGDGIPIPADNYLYSQDSSDRNMHHKWLRNI